MTAPGCQAARPELSDRAQTGSSTPQLAVGAGRQWVRISLQCPPQGEEAPPAAWCWRAREQSREKHPMAFPVLGHCLRHSFKPCQAWSTESHPSGFIPLLLLLWDGFPANRA